MTDVITLGELLIDFTACGKNEQGQRLFAQNPGGAPANVAVAVSRLGGKSAFIGKVGNDMHGRFLKNTLEENNVGCDHLILDNNHFTTLAFVDVGQDGEREFSFARKHGADKMLCADEIPAETIHNCRIFHFGSVSLTDDPARSATLFAAETAKSAGVIVAYDPNYRASLWENETTAKLHMRQAVQYADLVKISDEETALLTDESDFRNAAERLVEGGVTVAVVTLGKDGAYVCTKDGGVMVDGFKADAIDCTGAGDSFWGAFLLKIAQSGKKCADLTIDELTEFARFANAAASICVEKSGAIPSLPTIENVQHLTSQKRG